MVITKSKIFLYSCLSFDLGIGIASLFSFCHKISPLWWFIFFVFFAMQAVWFWEYKQILFWALVLAFFMFGVWRLIIGDNRIKQNDISLYNGLEAAVYGKVITEPKQKDKSQQLVLAVEKIVFINKKTNKKEKVASGKILLITNLFPVYQYGERLIISGRLNKPKPFAGFAYDRYLLNRGIKSVVYYPQIESAGVASGNIFYKFLNKSRNKLREAVLNGMSARSGAISLALLLGDKTRLNKKDREKLAHAGLSHMVAVSGLHIGIISLIVVNLFMAVGFSRYFSFYGAILILLFYIFLVGAPASAIRAGIMGFFFLLAYNIGRLGRALHLLIFTSALLLLFNPLLLLADLSFQLSFLSLLGIVLFFSVLRKIFPAGKTIIGKSFLDILVISLSAQIFTWPLIIYHFHMFSFIGPLVNVLVVWLLPLLMIFLFIGALLTLFYPGASFLFFFPAEVICHYISFVTDLSTKVCFGARMVSEINIFWLVLYYFLVFFLAFFLQNKKARNFDY